MVLIFNSNKSNIGKRYLQKSKIDSVFASKADSFNNWFSKNGKLIENYLTVRYLFEYDSFSDCFLKVYENILFSGIEIKNYRSYFISSYYKILANTREIQNRYCKILPNYDKEDINNEYSYELEEKQLRLESDIYDYIFSKYDVREFEIFKMYMILKPAINYSSLSEITGMKSHEIQRIVSLIKKDIRSNKEFIKRRKELL